MLELVREMAVARVSSCERRVHALRLLRVALVIDVAAAVVSAKMPGARFLVRSPLDFHDVADWISNSSESGYSEKGASNLNYQDVDAPSEYTEVKTSDTYEFAFFDDGVLRPIDSSVEALVLSVTGRSFNDLIELAHDNQLGAHLNEIAATTEIALGLVGWDSLVRSFETVQGDANAIAEGDAHWWGVESFIVVLDGLAAYQLVGEVMAHQGDDG